MEGEEKKKKQTQTIFIVAVALIVLILGYEGWQISSMVSKTKSNAKNEKEVVKRTPSKSDNDAKEESISSSESTTNESYNNNTETTPTNSIENVDVSTLTVDSSKVINSEAKGWNYSEMGSSNDNLGLGISANKNSNTAVIEISWFKFHNFSTGYMRKNAQGGTFGDNVQKITFFILLLKRENVLWWIASKNTVFNFSYIIYFILYSYKLKKIFKIMKD